MSEPFSLSDRIRSFGHAFRGVATLVREQHNARIHLLATLLVLAGAWWLQVQREEWWVLLLCIALVWMAEAINTALEYLCDAVVPEQHPLIGKAKDVAAAGVLICALVSAVIGLSVLLRYL